MTRIFSADGKATPVTAVAAGPCTVTAIKTVATDNYQAVQLGLGGRRKLSRALRGHLKKTNNFRYLREFRVDNAVDFKIGSQITVKVFSPGDKLKVTGISKGRGFQGVVKRHGFHGSPASHGHKDQLRMPGSIGATDPARVFKGKRMAGQMGNARVTIANLRVVEVNESKNIIYLQGAIPGARGSLLLLQGPGEMKLADPQPVELNEKNSAPATAETATPTDSVGAKTGQAAVAINTQNPDPVAKAIEEKK